MERNCNVDKFYANTYYYIAACDIFTHFKNCK